MKKLLSIFCGCILLTAMTCTKDGEGSHHHIDFYNSTDYALYIDRSFDYPDTSVLHFRNVMTPGWNLKVESHSNNHSALEHFESYECELSECRSSRNNILMVFVFNADTLETHGWDYAKEHNMVMQRYDLSLTDLQNLNWTLTFPPTEEMRNIKMWPPYGTYDENGNRLK